MALFDFIKDIAGLGAAGVGLADALGMGRSREARQAAALAERQASLAEALANPQSPMFQQARQQAMEQSRMAQLQGLRDLMAAQARQARRFGPGGSGTMMVSNPRRDEAIAREVALMGQNEAARADAAARRQLNEAIQGFGTASKAMAGAGELMTGQQIERMRGLMAALQGVGDIAGKLPGTFSAGKQALGFESPVQQSVNTPSYTMPADAAQRYTSRNTFKSFARG